MSRRNGGEKNIKSFDSYTHLLTMLYAVIMRFDSLREIKAAMAAEARKLQHLSLKKVPRRNILSDANARRSDRYFEEVNLDLYSRNMDKLSSDSRRNGGEEWIKRLRIIDSTMLNLFSNAIFKGVGRHPKTGRKKGGIKVHSVIHAMKESRATCSSPLSQPMTLSCLHRIITNMKRLSPWTGLTSITGSLRNSRTKAWCLLQK